MGNAVGDAVGVGVGRNVGAAENVGDSVHVGNAVGVGVGDSVGEAVNQDVNMLALPGVLSLVYLQTSLPGALAYTYTLPWGIFSMVTLSTTETSPEEELM